MRNFCQSNHFLTVNFEFYCISQAPAGNVSHNLKIHVFYWEMDED